MANQNLLIPFRRDRKRDLAHGTGSHLLASKVRQVLLTMGSTPMRQGELPWRTTFGSGLDLLRHRPNDQTLQALARVYVRKALQQWLPSVQVLRVDATSEGERLNISVQIRNQATEAAVEVSL